jgi:hypothetical protein
MQRASAIIKYLRQGFLRGESNLVELVRDIQCHSMLDITRIVPPPTS